MVNVKWSDTSQTDDIQTNWWLDDSLGRWALPVGHRWRGRGDNVVRNAGHAHVVFAVRAVAVVGVLSVAGQLAQGVGVLGQRCPVGLHPDSGDLSLGLITEDHMRGDRYVIRSGVQVWCRWRGGADWRLQCQTAQCRAVLIIKVGPEETLYHTTTSQAAQPAIANIYHKWKSFNLRIS